MINQNPWTILEDKKLLFIVQERGVYNWIDISIALGSNRTPFQCLARYQRSLNPHILNKDWTEDEDAKLRAAVDSFGDNNWQLVASNLEGRTGAQCSNRQVAVSYIISFFIFLQNNFPFQFLLFATCITIPFTLLMFIVCREA